MSKMIDTDNIAKLAKKLDDRAAAKVQLEEDRAIGIETALQENIDTLDTEAVKAVEYTGVDVDIQPDVVNRLNSVENSINNCNIINVKDYGAKGDGITDDTVAIQNAVNDLDDGILLFPEGIYNTQKINISKSNIIIKGNSSIIQSIKNTIHGLFVWSDNNYENIILDGIIFRGEMIEASSIIYFSGVTNLIIKNCSFTNCGGKAIAGMDGDINNNIIIENCNFDNTVNGGIEIRPCNDIIIRDCIFKNIVGYSSSQAAHPIYLRADTTKEGVEHTLKNVWVYNNIFKDIENPLYAATYAIKILINSQITLDDSIMGENIFIFDNKINWKGGIYISRLNNCYIENNYIYINSLLGVRFISLLIEKSNYVLIKNNILNTKCGDGLSQLNAWSINIDSTKNIKILNNNITNNFSGILQINNSMLILVETLEMINNTLSSNGITSADYAIQINNNSNINTFKFINNIQECDIRCIHSASININKAIILNNIFEYKTNTISTGIGVRLDNATITNKYQDRNVFIGFANPKNENEDKVF